MNPYGNRPESTAGGDLFSGLQTICFLKVDTMHEASTFGISHCYWSGSPLTTLLWARQEQKDNKTLRWSQKTESGMEVLQISQNKKSQDRIGSPSVQTLSPTAKSIFLHPGLPPTCSCFFHLSQLSWKACTWGPEPGGTRHSSISWVSVNVSHIAIRPLLDSSLPVPSCFLWKCP